LLVRFGILILLGGVCSAEEAPPSAPVESAVIPPVQSSPAATQPVSDGEYEIDYEEEVSPADEAPAPVPKRSAPRAQGGGTAVQGSRAKDRFTPILKSETKSVYKKGGKQLDVDPD
jgi:hypothetical protein